MSKARPRDNPIKDLLRGQAELAIREANLGAEDTKIATLYLIEQLPQLDIAMEMMLDRKTVGTRLKEIARKLRNAVSRISS